MATIGSERAAAEWILRLGGSIKFQDSDHWNFNYNVLPSGGYLEAIDATGLAVTSNGLEHLEGLIVLQLLSLSKCRYLFDDGLAHLHHVSNTLLKLDLSYCSGLTHKGLQHTTSLK